MSEGERRSLCRLLSADQKRSRPMNSSGAFATRLRIQQTVDHGKLFAITFALNVCAAIFVAGRK
jgi:hypothetical protein